MWGKARYVMTFSFSGEDGTQYPSIYSKSNQSFQSKLWYKQHTKIAESAKCPFIELMAGGHKKGQTPSHQHYCMQQAEALSIKDPSTELIWVSPHSQTMKLTEESEIYLQIPMWHLWTC